MAAKARVFKSGKPAQAREGAPPAPTLVAKVIPATQADAAPADFTASPLSLELSDFEFSVFNLMFGLQSWAETCMAAAGLRGLHFLDIIVLHAVNHRARLRKQSEICMILNIEDTHLVSYALKKLIAAELVQAVPKGRERYFETTESGAAACMAYRKVREDYLVPNLSWVIGRDNMLKETAGFLRTMTALYAQSGRFAAAATAGLPKAPPVHTKR